MDDQTIGVSATDGPDGQDHGRKSGLSGNVATNALQRLEQQALQELAAARPLADTVNGPIDALAACISWDLQSPPC